jgi:hypothetical protein
MFTELRQLQGSARSLPCTSLPVVSRGHRAL